MSDLQSLFTDCLNETLIRVILSNPSSKDGVIKICARPMLKNKSLLFQIEEYTKTQVFHKNLTAGDAGSYLTGKLSSDTSSQTASFKNALVETQSFTANVLVSKKGTITIKKKMNASAKQPKISLSHNRKKKYILEEGIPVPFLIDLGKMETSLTLTMISFVKSTVFLNILKIFFPHFLQAASFAFLTLDVENLI